MRLRAFWTKHTNRVRAGIIALARVCVCIFGPMPAAEAETDGMIRVSLTRLGAPGEVVLSVDCDYYLASDPGVRISSGDKVKISADGDSLTLKMDGKKYSLGRTVKLMRSASGASRMPMGAVCEKKRVSLPPRSRKVGAAPHL